MNSARAPQGTGLRPRASAPLPRSAGMRGGTGVRAIREGRAGTDADRGVISSLPFRSSQGRSARPLPGGRARAAAQTPATMRRSRCPMPNLRLACSTTPLCRAGATTHCKPSRTHTRPMRTTRMIPMMPMRTAICRRLQPLSSRAAAISTSPATVRLREAGPRGRRAT